VLYLGFSRQISNQPTGLGGAHLWKPGPVGFGWQALLKAVGWALILLGALWFVTASVEAQSSDLELPYDEEEAQSIDRMLICPVCPAETIDQAQVELSKQMRRIVREMLARGVSRTEILNFFVDRYGPAVLAAPPKSGKNVLAWILPAVGVLVALAGVLAIIWSMASRNAVQTHTESALDEDLAPYLEAVDRELALIEDGSIGRSQDQFVPAPEHTDDVGNHTPCSDVEFLRKDELK
jgi:cytochrome c-type biogenesis protein CcmH